MIDDRSSRVNTELSVVPAYGTAEAAVIQPERQAPLSLYAVQRWLPKLGGQRLALVLVLRALAFDAPTAADGTRRVTVSRDALAQAAGVANAGTVGEWLRSEAIVGGGGWRRIARSSSEAEALAHFIPRLRYAYSGRVRTGLVICVRMDDPLAPEDEPLAERYRLGQQTAGASQLAIAALVPSSGAPAPRNSAIPSSSPSVKGDIPPSHRALKDGKPFSFTQVTPPASADSSREATGRGLNPEQPLSVSALKSLFSLSSPSSAAGPVVVAATSTATAVADRSLTTASPLSSAAANAPEQPSALCPKDGQPSSAQLQTTTASPAVGPEAVKAAIPPVNVNDNETNVVSVQYEREERQVDETPYDRVTSLAEGVRLMPSGVLGALEVRHAVEPLVAITVQQLDDAGSAAFFRKAYACLYLAGRMDLAVTAMAEACAGTAERPGAVFTASLKRLCARNGVSLGLKGEAQVDRVGPVRAGAACENEGDDGDGASEPSAAAADAGERAEQRMWAQARRELEASMVRSTYDTWLRNCELVGVRWDDPVEVVLAFPHQTAREWVSRRLSGSVERVLSSVVGRPARLECVVAERAAAGGEAGYR